MFDRAIELIELVIKLSPLSPGLEFFGMGVQSNFLYLLLRVFKKIVKWLVVQALT